MALAISARLAKAGYWGGDLEKILQAPVELVLAALQYEIFMSDYDRATFELNRTKPA